MTAGTVAASARERQVLDRRRVYVFPSRAGLTFAAALTLMLLGAVNYDNGLAYVLTFLLAGLLLVCILHTWRNLAGLVYAGGHAAPVFAGGWARFELILDNRGGRLRPDLRLECRPRRRGWHRRRAALATGTRVDVPAGPSIPSSFVPCSPLATGTRVDVPAGSLTGATLRLAAAQRGRLALPRLCISTRFPLGLVRAWSYVDPGLDCLVYPTPRGTLPLPLAGAEQHERPIGALPGSEDFAGFGPYRAGDPPRSIAWKALARGQPLLVKRFAGSGGGGARMLRLADCAVLPNLERQLEQLCRWVLDCEASMTRYGLQLPGVRLEPAQGELHRSRCLRELALYGRPR